MPGLENEDWELWEAQGSVFYHCPARDATQWHKPGTDQRPEESYPAEEYGEGYNYDADKVLPEGGAGVENLSKPNADAPGLAEPGTVTDQRKKSLASQLYSDMLIDNHAKAKKRIGRNNFKGTRGTGKTYQKKKLTKRTFEIGDVVRFGSGVHALCSSLRGGWREAASQSLGPRF